MALRQAGRGAARLLLQQACSTRLLAELAPLGLQALALHTTALKLQPLLQPPRAPRTPLRAAHAIAPVLRSEQQQLPPLGPHALAALHTFTPRHHPRARQALVTPPCAASIGDAALFGPLALAPWSIALRGLQVPSEPTKEQAAVANKALPDAQECDEAIEKYREVRDLVYGVWVQGAGWGE